MYLWELKDWPDFRWDGKKLIEPLGAARFGQGKLLGTMAGLGFRLKLDAELDVLTDDVTKSSEIEGDRLDRDGVRSSIALKLGVHQTAPTPTDRRTESVVEMMLEATSHFAEPLGEKQLFAWQTALFPDGRSDLHTVKTGGWRDDSKGPMQVVSGAMGREKVHYEAPPADRLEPEMERFIAWFNSRDEQEPLLRAALAHMWFVMIHPFDDGNGRLARAITDKALAQGEGAKQRYYSMSAQIFKESSDYYAILERTGRSGLDVTAWLSWFLACFTRAISSAEVTLQKTLQKAEFWQRFAEQPLNERQNRILNRYIEGFEGNLTAKKWAAMGKCSIPTAIRDITDLIERGILRRNPGGSKNTTYEIIL